MPFYRSLIINADDFGYNDAITRGILQGYRDGLITSTSAMINIEGAPQRIRAAHAEQPGLPIGLHLNLTAGRPVLPPRLVPHLVQPDGSFYLFEQLLPCMPEIPPEEVRAEICAQAEALLAAGVRFDHIDAHQHALVLYPPIFEQVAYLAQTYQVPVRQTTLAPVRGRLRLHLLSGLGSILGFTAQVLLRRPVQTMRVLAQLGSGARRQAVAQLPSTDWFIGAFFGDPALENFTAILRRLPPGLSELMTHPAVESPELYTMPEDYRAERPRELAVLLDPRARDAINELGIQLTNFSACKKV